MNDPMQPNADRLIEVFDQAKSRSPGAEREALLAGLCRDEPGLMEEVRSLLQVYEEVGDFLVEAPSTPAALFLTERLGDRIGPYKLLQQIGEGGCGIVYMAEQELPVRRHVAVKIIKLGMDTRQVVARFEAERQAVALMDHPSIAKVFEAGATETGRPYFVMELVRGIKITEFCDQEQLSTGQRLRLFIQVCHAIQHAHQKGVIHRDIKPSNILVALHDAVPVPTVIDFGIAKATTDQPLTGKTLFTAFEQFIGTPAYMSPEQAGMSPGLPGDVDTRSDIYSLGVLLYELLTGKTPFDPEELAAGGLDGMRRTIRERQPPRPSTRLSRILATATPRASAQSKIQNPKSKIPSDLDWIVMKCLEKDRRRRYETANGLAMDLKRHLQNEPVIARPPGPAYRFRKLVHRNKIAAGAVMAVAVTLVAGLLASGWQAVRATRAERAARRDAYYHHITLAQHELAADNLRGALQLLEECPKDLRGWEWHYLMRLGRIEPLILRHTSDVHSIAFHPGGQQLAAGYGDGVVRIWDLRSGQIIHTLTGHTQYILSVAFRPHDGRFLASASGDHTVRVWDLSTGKELFQRPGSGGEYTGMGTALAFSADGKRLIAGREEGVVSIWAADSGREIHRLPENQEIRATSVACSADGRFLATGSWGGVLRIWDARTYQLLHRREHPIRIGGVTFPTNGCWLATASFDRTVKIWNPINGNVLTNWRAHDAIIPGLAVSPNGARLATLGGEDKAIKLWDPLTGREFLKLRGHVLSGECVTFSPDGLRLASADGNGSIRIWDATPLDASEPPESRSLRHDDEVWTVAFSPDGRLLASAGWDKTVRLWDARSGAAIGELPHRGIIFRVAFSPDSRFLAVAAISERIPMIFVWDTRTRESVLSLSEGKNTPFFAMFDPSGRYLLKEGPDHTVKIVNALTGELVGAIADWNIWCMAFSPDSRQFATASGEGWVKVWAWDSVRIGQAREPLFKVPVPVFGYGEKVAFSPDGRQLLTGGVGNAIKVWDAQSGAELPAPLIEHTGDVFALAFSPNGRWLASAGEDTTVRIWDAKSWRLVRTLRGHLGMVVSLAFRPDGQRLASASRDHTVHLWETSLWEQPPDGQLGTPPTPVNSDAKTF